MRFSNVFIRRILFIAGLVNIIMGGLAASLPELPLRLLFGLDPSSMPFHLVFYHVGFWSFVAAVGAGYLVAAQNSEQNRGVILIGALGKLWFVGMMLYAFFVSKATPLAFAAVVWDGTLGILFVVFLYHFAALKNESKA